MKPAPFEMHRPRHLAEALALLSDEPEARVLAGGQSLVPMMNLRVVSPPLLIDLNSIEGLAGIELHHDVLRIGAMTRQSVLMDSELVRRHTPLLSLVVPHIGHVQTRSRGTVGGSLSHADPSAELPLAMVTLDAVMHVSRAGATRTIAARDFFQDILTTSLEPGEVLTHVDIPVVPNGARSHFVEFARRHGDFAITSCAVQFVPGSQCLQVVLGGVGGVPHRCALLIETLGAANFDPSAIDRAVEREVVSLEPLVDLQADAALRRQLARTALSRCLAEVLP